SGKETLTVHVFGSFENWEINPLADPPFARLSQGCLLNQENDRRVNRFQSCLHPWTRSLLVQPSCRADAQHICEYREAKPEHQKTRPGLMLFVADCFVLIHRGSTLPISTHLGSNRP